MRLKANPEYEALRDCVMNALDGFLDEIPEEVQVKLQSQIMNNINDTFSFGESEDD